MAGGGLPLLVTCEHASHAVPAALTSQFVGAQDILRSHRGWDPFALEVARRLAREFSVPLIAGRYSRLVVDLNRSPHHRGVFSPWTRALDEGRKQRLRKLHAAHWARVSDAASALLERHGRAVHVAVHSFTPVLDGERRNADIGLLYDPRRRSELALARQLREQLATPDCRVRRNYPYRGVADGLPTALRARLGPAYAGLELELNQAFARRHGVPDVTDRVFRALCVSLG